MLKRYAAALCIAIVCIAIVCILAFTAHGAAARTAVLAGFLLFLAASVLLARRQTLYTKRDDRNPERWKAIEKEWERAASVNVWDCSNEWAGRN